jgi:hypothetical protein
MYADSPQAQALDAPMKAIIEKCPGLTDGRIRERLRWQGIEVTQMIVNGRLERMIKAGTIWSDYPKSDHNHERHFYSASKPKADMNKLSAERALAREELRKATAVRGRKAYYQRQKALKEAAL